MKLNKKIILGIVIGIFLFSLVYAEPSYCCEKTTSGAWCQNAPLSECNSDLQTTPTSCESTSYCKLGCCYDSDEGTCAKNTPEVVCSENNGVWEESASCDIPQCELGCCLIGNEAAFVPKQRCKKLSSVYGLEITFRTDISTEFECIISTTSDKEGACVYEEEFQTNCKFITKDECLSGGYENVSFYEDYLCSAQELGTICSMTSETTCVDGRDEVFFVDSCGNLANIYDSSKVKDQAYWTKIVSVNEACGYGDSNADSKTCGNCNYYLGSTCKEYERGTDRAQPTYGDNICRDLSCESGGIPYQHGETWCASSSGVSENLPGSRHFRLVCYDNEILVEPCADYRQEICLQSSVNGFKTAGCRANRWQDCILQDKKTDCENTDQRDCRWYSGSLDGCFPSYNPGFNFWEEGDADEICGQATAICNVECTDPLDGDGDEECDGDPPGCVYSNGDISDAFTDEMNLICTMMGDCGVKVNYVGVEGYNSQKEDDDTDSDFA